MNKKYRLLTSCLLLLVLPSLLFGDVVLKSLDEDYLDFLSLHGVSERPYMSVRNFSLSTWETKEDNHDIWKGTHSFDTPIIDKDGFSFTVYGLEWFTSYNTKYPLGQNDGALWQGKGFNANVSTGFKLTYKGLSLVLKPNLSFSQNLEFKTYKVKPGYVVTNNLPYGYIWTSMDFPQRFGDEPFFTFDWGESEIRYTVGCFSVGLGTQAIWIGPSYLNSMLHSNNAANYPKVDMGIYLKDAFVPFTDWNMGNIEARLWTGLLSYSKYYYSKYDDLIVMINGTSFSWQPKFAPGLTLSFTVAITSDTSERNISFIFDRLSLFHDNSTDGSMDDGKAAFSASYLIPSIGFEVFGEIGVDDWSSTGFGLIGMLTRYPFHTMVYTVGAKKTVDLNQDNKVYGEIIFEWNNLEMSQDFYAQWGYTFYDHGAVSNTNKGQILGAGSGWGGNSQYLAFNLFYPKGKSTFLIHRSNPDNNFVYNQMVYRSASSETDKQFHFAQKGLLIIGANSDYFVTPKLTVSGGMYYNFVMNENYLMNDEGVFDGQSMWYSHNFRFTFGGKFTW